jgi:protein-L-isoaspartate(D-aspartate) O-methyltransferase
MDRDLETSRRLRDKLVDTLQQRGRLTSEPVAAAFRAVPRECFLPGLGLDEVYRDAALIIKRGPDGVPTSSSSQPSIMATMLEQLAVEPGHKVLEIGAGSGYNAALLARLVGERGSVTSVDLDQELVTAARDHLDRAGESRVRLVCADGGHGQPDGAPYDRIIVTVGAADLPPPWLDQLTPDGRLVLPLSLRGMQRSIAFERCDQGFVSVSVHDCGFMPLRGAFAADDTVIRLGSAEALLRHSGRVAVDPDAVRQALAGPAVEVAGRVPVSGSELFGGPALWLALNEPAFARLTDAGISLALIGERSIARVVGPRWADLEPVPVTVHGFGPDGERLARLLLDQVADWDRAGRPATSDLRIVVHPPGAEVTAAAIVDLKHARLAIDWA